VTGINVDPLNPDNAPRVDELQRTGVRWVRLVSRDDDAVRQYVEMCWSVGLMVLAVITEQSGGYLCPADVYQGGNEPDVAGTGDSMSPGAYVAYWNLYRKTYPELVMVGAGLGSGQISYWQQVQAAGGLQGASGFAVHPYAKTAVQAKTMLAAYQKITPSLPLWVTEWNRPPAEVPAFASMLRQVSVMDAWFCWSPSVARGVGIYELDASTKRVLGAVA
jgi:hypothetical protein